MWHSFTVQFNKQQRRMLDISRIVPLSMDKKRIMPLSKKKKHLPIKEDIQLPIMGDMSKDCRGWRVSALNLRHIDTLRIAGPPTPHRRSTQVAGTSEQVVLITQPTTKLPCQHPSTKVMRTSAHPGVLWEEPHQTQSINDDRRGPS